MADDERRTCGIIRPIAAMGDYPESHWTDVHEIVCAAIEPVGFTGRVVSTSEYATVIQGSIVKNLYEDPLVICDVSGRNANVMFELGMRLAFDKPTIIIKDDVTPFSFDTSPIEHVSYPRDLRYQSIVAFKEELARKASATADAPTKEGFTSFLAHFGPIVSAKIEKKEVSWQEFILDELSTMRSMIQELHSFLSRQKFEWARTPTPTMIPISDNAAKLAAAGFRPAAQVAAERDQLAKIEQAMKKGRNPTPR